VVRSAEIIRLIMTGAFPRLPQVRTRGHARTRAAPIASMVSPLTILPPPLPPWRRPLWRRQVSLPWVSIVDVTRAHVAAMTHPGAPGKRFAVYGRAHTFKEVGDVLGPEFNRQGYGVPTGAMPHWMLRLASWFDSGAAGISVLIGRVRRTCRMGCVWV
jgi:nucleoside-diphosphate-sugar epimerase